MCRVVLAAVFGAWPTQLAQAGQTEMSDAGFSSSTVGPGPPQRQVKGSGSGQPSWLVDGSRARVDSDPSPLTKPMQRNARASFFTGSVLAVTG